MSTITYLTFIGTVLIVILSPGPATMLSVTHGMRFGWRSVFATALGDISANFLQMIIAVTGLGLLLATSALAFTALKILGCAYLVYLAIKTIRAPAPDFSKHMRLGEKEFKPFFWRFRQGFLVSFTSLKALAFYGALFPQFISPDHNLLPQFFILAVSVATIDYTVVVLYGFGADRLGTKLFASGKGRLINRFSGVALLAAATLLAFTQRDSFSVPSNAD